MRSAASPVRRLGGVRVVLDLIIIGLAITLEPITIVAFILILAAEKGVRKGAAFILGWLACLVVVVAVVVLATGGKPPDPHTAPSTAALVVKAAVGVVLIAVAARQWRRKGGPRKQPTWMAKLDRLSPWAAAGLGVFLQPWSLVAAGAATVVQAKLSNAGDYLSLVLFCLLATSSFLVMELYAAFAPEAAGARLERVRAWIDSHRDQAIVVGSLVVGCWLVGNSIYVIVS
ncbi:MAG TPA: GAP family protein [Streptosporangiaceae bacterium]|nr:GAP family protein [Streptosporangiaceae bacterium]